MSTLRRMVEKMHSDAIERIQFLDNSIQSYKQTDDVINAQLCQARRDTLKIVVERLEECLNAKEDNQNVIDTDWKEAHFVISVQISELSDTEKHMDNVAIATQEKGGIGALYELSEMLTDKFQLLHKDTIWGEDLDWQETIDDFISTELLTT